MKRTLMLAISLTIALLSFGGCAGSAPTRAEPSPFTIISETNDPATHSAMVIITVPPPATPAEVKAAAESVIAARRERFARITVKSFTEKADLNGVPLAVSKFEGAGVDHVFTSSLPASQRIQTH